MGQRHGRVKLIPMLRGLWARLAGRSRDQAVARSIDDIQADEVAAEHLGGVEPDPVAGRRVEQRTHRSAGVGRPINVAPFFGRLPAPAANPGGTEQSAIRCVDLLVRGGRRRFARDARAVAGCRLADRVDDAAAAPCTDRQRPASGRRRSCAPSAARSRRSPTLRAAALWPTTISVHSPCRHEERLLCVLPVIHPDPFARLEDVDVDPEVGKRRFLEVAVGTERPRPSSASRAH